MQTKKITSMVLAVLMLLSMVSPLNSYASNEIKVIVNFDETLNQTQEKTIVLPNLGEIKSISSNTGNVTYSSSGDQVTLNVSGGAPSRSEQITIDKEGWLSELKTQSTQTFADTVTKVNAKGETVNLVKDGVPFVVSGSFTPSDSKTETQTQTNSTGTFANTVSYNSGGYSGTLSKSGAVTSTVVSGSYTAPHSKTVSENRTSSTNSFANTIAYNSGGYVGTLNKNGSSVYSLLSGSYTPADSKSVSVAHYGQYYCDWHSYYNWYTGQEELDFHCSPTNNYTISYNSDGYVGQLHFSSVSHYSDRTGVYYGNINYSGLVTRPESDTRVYGWRQNYSGIVTTPAVDTRVYSYTQNYSGTVTKPAVDTRTWGQNYKVWTVIGEEEYTQNHYSYSVEITYGLNYTVDLDAIDTEVTGMRQEITSRQANDKLDDYTIRLTEMTSRLNEMPNVTEVSAVKTKVTQTEKLIQAMTLILKMENGTVIQNDLYNTQNIISDIDDPALAEALSAQLNQTGSTSEVVKVVRKAEQTFERQDINRAISRVKAMDNDHPEKVNLVARVEAVRETYNGALTEGQISSLKKNAIYYTAQVESFGTVYYYQRAKAHIDLLQGIDDELMSQLNERLTPVAQGVAMNNSFVDFHARRSVEHAEIYKLPRLIEEAERIIGLLSNNALRTEYQARLDLLK